MKNLIPLSDFVLDQKKRLAKSGWQSTVENSLELIFNYTEFLKQPLKLEMFVPCDKHGVVFKEAEENQEYYDEISKVIFIGFSIVRSHIESSKHTLFLRDPKGDWIGHKHDWEDHWDIYGKTVECFCGRQYELTPSALQQIGIKE